MAASSDQNGQVSNIHIDVETEFHKKLKMMCVMKDTTIKQYARDALAAALERDEAELQASRASAAPAAAK